MSTYICLKPVTLCGVRYKAGSAIPTNAVLPSRIRTLTNQGFIMKNTLSEPSSPGGCASGCGDECGCGCVRDLGSGDDIAAEDSGKKPEDNNAGLVGGLGEINGGMSEDCEDGEYDGGGSEEASPDAATEHQQIANTIAEETAQIMMQALDSRKAINAALRAKGEEGAL